MPPSIPQPVGPAARAARHDRFRGALLGLAVGDALGTTLEFQRPPFPHHADMIGGGPFDMAPGEWTDDTSMACCLAESLIARAGFDARDQMERYVRWWREGHWSVKGHCFDIGVTTHNALARFRERGDPFAGGTGERDNGNGSLMRLAPIPMAFFRDPVQAVALAADSSRTTHGGDRAVDACRYFAALIAAAIGGVPKASLLDGVYTPRPGFWDDAPLTPPIVAAIHGAADKPEAALRSGGYVMESFELALAMLARTDTYRDGLVAAVNMGHDADTSGAIYGQLAGAIYGASAIPAAWLDRLAWRDRLEALIDGLWLLAGGDRVD